MPRALFPLIDGLQGDIGARNLIVRSGLPVIDVEIGHAAEFDVDTVKVLLAAGEGWRFVRRRAYARSAPDYFSF